MKTFLAELKGEFWRPDERKIWVRKQMRWSWGWTINFAEIVRRLRERRAARSSGKRAG